jgi:hypothetical protein
MGYKLAQQPSKETLPPLSERIALLRADIDSYIDSLVDKDAGYGVPRQVLRDLITNRATGCHCRQYLIASGEIV